MEIKVTWYMSDLHACGHIRGELLARAIAGSPGADMVCKTNIMPSDFKRSDVMVFQRQYNMETLEKIAWANREGIATIYEIDDDLFHVPSGFKKPYHIFKKDEIRQIMADSMATCDAVSVTTPQLAKAVSRYVPGKPIYVIPNVLDTEHWEPAWQKRLEQKRETVTIGWFASGSHQIETRIIAGALRRIMERHDNVRLCMVGWIGFADLGSWARKYKDRIIVTDWIDINDLPYAVANFDIGLAPLRHNKFNFAKSNIKWLQYGALEIPCVASDYAPYKCIENGVDGVVVKNSEQRWFDALDKLVLDKDKREAIGKAARARVLREYTWQTGALHWLKMFSEVAKMKQAQEQVA